MTARRGMAYADFSAQFAQRKPRNPALFQRHFGCLEQSLAQITVMIRTRIRLQHVSIDNIVTDGYITLCNSRVIPSLSPAAAPVSDAAWPNPYINWVTR